MEVPHDNDAERKILGTIIVYPDRMEDVLHIVDEHMFYLERHKHVFATLKHLHSKGSIDIVSLTDTMGRRNLLGKSGGRSEVTALAGDAINSNAIEAWAIIVRDKFNKRRLYEYGHQLSNMAVGPSDTGDLIDKM